MKTVAMKERIFSLLGGLLVAAVTYLWAYPMM